MASGCSLKPRIFLFMVDVLVISVHDSDGRSGSAR